jgi:transcriptional regulator with XRE-family HTH domain
MPILERPADAGTERGRKLARSIGTEVQIARRMAGVSQRTLGRAAGLSGSEVGRIERGEAPWLSIEHAARLLRTVGLDLWVKTYPVGPPIRDAGHLRLIADFEARLPASITARREWPIPNDRDRRALDVLLVGLPLRTAVEAETVLSDLQALERDVNLKRRDARLGRMILLVRKSRRNLRVLRAADALRHAFPLRTRAVMAALAQGLDPGADGIVVL